MLHYGGNGACGYSNEAAGGGGSTMLDGNNCDFGMGGTSSLMVVMEVFLQD